MHLQRSLSQKIILSLLIGCLVAAAFMPMRAQTAPASTIVRWGSILFNAPQIGLSNVVAIDSGYEHSVVVKSDGTIACFGNACYAPMLNAPSINDFVAASSGSFYTLALRSNGTVKAWGDNYFGEAVVPAGLTGVVAINAANRQSMALKSDGTVISWGQFGSNVPT